MAQQEVRRGHHDLSCPHSQEGLTIGVTPQMGEVCGCNTHKPLIRILTNGREVQRLAPKGCRHDTPLLLPEGWLNLSR